MTDTATRVLAHRALAAAADAASTAPSVLDSQPWQLVLHPDHLELRADRSRQVSGVDRTARSLVQGVGSALLDARVSLAAQGWATRVDRVPAPEAPDVLARVFPMAGDPDAALARLGAVLDQVPGVPAPAAVDASPEAGMRALAAAAVDEGAVLFPVLTSEQHRLVDGLTERAGASQGHDPAVLASVRYWTHLAGAVGDRAPAEHPRAHRDPDAVLVVLATHTDDLLARLRSGEAVQRVTLEVALAGWTATPVRPALEIATTRADLRAGLTWGTWPQAVLQLTPGPGPAPVAMNRRRRSDVVRTSGLPTVA